MRLPDFLVDSRFNVLRRDMGAPLADTFRVQELHTPIVLPPLEDRLAGDGVDVSAEDIVALKDGTLSYKNHRVLVYIRDVSDYGGRGDLPKFHVAHCRTLENMKMNNRWSRYVVANRDDGLFSLNIASQAGRAKMVGLAVCQNCLGTLGWEGFSRQTTAAEKTNRVKNFRLKDFFTKYPRDLLAVVPDHSSDSAPLNAYPSNWLAVSVLQKQRSNFQCVECQRILLGVDSRFLHVHHLNGQKNDCSESNLAVLCIRCHARSPMHSHMRALPEYEEFNRLFPE
jgi:5-methylcytosine-specific restriction endonuclease McrA